MRKKSKSGECFDEARKKKDSLRISHLSCNGRHRFQLADRGRRIRESRDLHPDKPNGQRRHRNGKGTQRQGDLYRRIKNHRYSSAGGEGLHNQQLSGLVQNHVQFGHRLGFHGVSHQYPPAWQPVKSRILRRAGLFLIAANITRRRFIRCFSPVRRFNRFHCRFFASGRFLRAFGSAGRTGKLIGGDVIRSLCSAGAETAGFNAAIKDDGGLLYGLVGLRRLYAG